jgi:RimJ/RimL family protein N-acetyltransferase
MSKAMTTLNEQGQEVGHPIPDWTIPEMPPRDTLIGRYCRVEPLHIAKHADDLHAAFSVGTSGADWSYLPYGPFDSLAAFESWLSETCFSNEPIFFAIIDLVSGKAVGMASYLNINRVYGTIEVGHVHFSPLLQRSRVATEAMYLMMGHAFGTGYRRYEWKCNAFNARSRKAAIRFGFSYEGVFRNHMVVRGHNRDSAWYACVDGEWPQLKTAYETWLDDANFNAAGQQVRSLADLTRPLLVATD